MQACQHPCGRFTLLQSQFGQRDAVSRLSSKTLRLHRPVHAQATIPEKHAKVETRARVAFANKQKASGKSANVAADLLQQAARTKKVDPWLTLGAALHIEEQASSQTETLSRLDGRWQLVFASTSGSTLLWYIPVQEFKDINVSEKSCKLVSRLGPFTTSFNGSYTPVSKQDMQFQFTQLVITAFGRTLVDRPISFAQKVYTYCWLQDNLALARSSGGGVVLLKRPNK